MLKFENIEKSFGEKKVLRGVSLTLEKGDICALSGMIISILLGPPVGSTIVAVDTVAFFICYIIGALLKRT